MEDNSEWHSYSYIHQYPNEATLYIGGIRSVSEQRTDHFDRIISVCQDTRSDNVSCLYVHIPLADGHHNATQWGGDDSYETFRQACEAVLHALTEGDTVLVHCHHGVNRSVSAAIVAMCWYEARMWGYSHDPEGIYDLIRSKRPVANPHGDMVEYINRALGTEWEPDTL